MKAVRKGDRLIMS